MDEDSSWRERASCRGLPAALFVPSEAGGSLKRAYRVCNGDGVKPPCPVRAECYAFAVESYSVGVFGGVHHSPKASRQIAVVTDIQDARPR